MYSKTDRPIDEIKNLMFIDLNIAADDFQDTAEVDSEMGFMVKGGMKGANRMNISKKHGKPEIRGTDNKNYKINPHELDIIIELIEIKEIELEEMKWSKEDDISNMTSVSQCELYENEPYTEDGQIKFKNNIKEWK